MNKIRFAIIFEEVFHISLVTYLMLLLIETVKPGFVSYFFNLNILLIVVLISGIGRELLRDERIEKVEQQTKPSKPSGQLITIMCIGGGLLVYHSIQELGNIALIISMLATLLIFLLSYLIRAESDTPEK